MNDPIDIIMLAILWLMAAGAAAVTAVLVWWLWDYLHNPCIHVWETHCDKELPSKMAEATRLGYEIDPSKGMVPASTFAQTHIYILSCRRCGKVNKTVTRS